MKEGILLVMALGAVIFIGFQTHMFLQKSRRTRSIWDGDGKQIVEGNFNFSLDLYKSISHEHPIGNLFFSPLSISAALAMILKGARGKTAEQVLDTLSLNKQASSENFHGAFRFILRELSSNEDNYILHLANKVYVDKQYDMLDSFKHDTHHFYNTETQHVNFNDQANTKNRINTWVEEVTKNNIPNLLNNFSLGKLSLVVLVNAIYFNGNWMRKFPIEATKATTFHVRESYKVTVDMMYQRGPFLHMYDPESELRAIELPYSGGDLTMTILLPTDIEGLPALEKVLTLDKLKSISAAMTEESVDVYLPKFNITWDMDLSVALIKMGMQELFMKGHADLSGISGKRDLALSHVVHQANIGVSETGNEAAAATVSVFGSVPQFKADHPFIYFITDQRTGSIVFMGRLAKPLPCIE